MSEPKTGKIRFSKPDLKSRLGELQVNYGANLMRSLLAAGLPVASSCGGDGVCSKCRLHIRELTQNSTSKPTALEKGLLHKINADSDERISCQTQVEGEIEVDADYW